MLDLAREIIGSQPILTAFLAIGLGYLVGQISIGGFSLGVGAVLFVGLAIGAFAPKAHTFLIERLGRRVSKGL
jgi:putative transport protein